MSTEDAHFQLASIAFEIMALSFSVIATGLIVNAGISKLTDQVKRIADYFELGRKP